MKAIIKLLIGIILGVVVGWFIGFLRLPYIEMNHSFILGFIACVVVVLLILLLLMAWNNNSALLRLINKTPSYNASKTVSRTYRIIRILIATIIVAGGVLSSFLIYKQSNYFKTQMQNQDRKIREQSALIESIRKGNMVFLMSNILNNVEEELKNSRTLSDVVIARIAALSFSFKPYKYFQGDSLSAKELSPERGQLMMALLLMKMDSGSFARIKQMTSFASADLRGASLKHADLSGANLKHADLKDADLGEANLNNANLWSANLWGANLDKANLSGADLKRSDLRWAALNGTHLNYADLNGAQLSSAQLVKADVLNAFVQYADLEGAILSEANLAGVNFLGAGMRKINLNNANLTRTDLRMTDLNDATLLGTELNKALVDSNWMDKIDEWRLTGSKEIQDNYTVVTDSLDQWKHKVYHLSKIEK
ncbi:MAG: pentapeptide repeat-containing protein [Chitinophagaceae bacterium]|nr:pentapeptide repeat-containing protein [Chitinophagaceae bacterium]